MATSKATQPGPNKEEEKEETYTEKLKTAVQEAKNEADQSGKAATKAKQEHEIAKAHKDELKDLFDRMEITIGLAQSFVSSLNGAIDHANKVCTNVSKSAEGVETLAVFIKCLYDDTGQLEKQVKTLNDDIEAIGSESLTGDGAKLVACLKELHQELKTSLENHKAALDAIIILYRCVMEFQFLICDGEENEVRGLANEFKELETVLCLGYCAGVEASDSGSNHCNGSANEDISAIVDCCKDRLPEGYSPVDPKCIEKMQKPKSFTTNGISVDFKNDVSKWKDTACNLADFKKCAHEYYDKKRAGAQARYDAAKMALKAAEAAEALCK